MSRRMRVSQLAGIGVVAIALVIGSMAGSAHAIATCFGLPPTFSCTITVIPAVGPVPNPVICNNGGPAAGNATFCDGQTTVEFPADRGLIIIGDCLNGFGQATDDVVIGSGYGDVIATGQGSDTVCALGGDDAVDGGDDPDTLDGGAGHDCMSGGDGDDKLFGQGGKDVLFGNGGFDALNGGLGFDVCIGGPGFDAGLASLGGGGCEVRVQGTPAEP